MNYKQLIYSLVFILACSKLFSQSALNFGYDRYNDFKNPVYANIKLRFPNHSVHKLFSDSAKVFDYFQKRYFKKPGNYSISVAVNIIGEKSDSVNYPLYIDGTETEIEIRISVYTSPQQKSNGQYDYEHKDTECSISVIKYYKPPKSIKLTLINLEPADYKAPFFRLDNFSKDTLYGYFLPGYFWGALKHKLDNSTWSEKSYWTLDLNCGKRPPLYPDSSTTASIGTWGIDSLQKGSYKYELIVATMWNGVEGAVSEYLDHDSIKWQAGVHKYYKLEYEFEIK
jgi:hypothetical protein